MTTFWSPYTFKKEMSSDHRKGDFKLLSTVPYRTYHIQYIYRTIQEMSRILFSINFEISQ